MLRVALVSMPFAAIDYPSLALGLFKSRFEREGIPCDIHYLNISFGEMIGYSSYSMLISQPPAYFAAEQIFAEAAFGAAVPPDESYYNAAGLAPHVRQHLQAIKSCVEPFLARCLAEVDWRAYDIIGFTSLFEQNLATLAFARRLKQLYPEKILVFGGPNFESVMGETYHRLLPFMDLVCSGECDDTFPELVKRLAYRHPIYDLPGVVYRRNGLTYSTGQSPMTTALDALPIPDFSEYFARVRNMVGAPSGLPSNVLLETSRGCWWGEKNHCTFCGLNSQGMTYRSKSSDRAVEEVETLKNRYGATFVRVVDNILNHRFFDDFLPSLADKNLGVSIFFEVKANLRKHQVAILKSAGVTVVQAGIESLSTHTLKLMRKGATALMNVQTLKWCREQGILCDWNLIYGFPGETPEDYRLSTDFARVLTHLSPPTGCGPIRLDRFSPNYDHAAELGFVNVRPLSWYSFLYPFAPDDLGRIAYFFDFDYATLIDDGGHRPALHEAVNLWKQRNDRLEAHLHPDGLLIYDTRPVAKETQTILNEVGRVILESCDQIATIGKVRQAILQRLGKDFTEEETRNALAQLIDRHILLREEDRYLSLPLTMYALAEPKRPGASVSKAEKLVQVA
jgi:ribosomal peptide maturation radical SAM protein 1